MVPLTTQHTANRHATTQHSTSVSCTPRKTTATMPAEAKRRAQCRLRHRTCDLSDEHGRILPQLSWALAIPPIAPRAKRADHYVLGLFALSHLPAGRGGGPGRGEGTGEAEEQWSLLECLQKPQCQGLGVYPALHPCPAEPCMLWLYVSVCPATTARHACSTCPIRPPCSMHSPPDAQRPKYDPCACHAANHSQCSLPGLHFLTR